MIGILDSGIGGLPYLAAVRRLLPSESFAYFADTASFPYGTRPTNELVRIVHNAVASLIDAADPTAVVIACNTASVVSLSELRARFALPFVGVVPAVKPAAAISPTGRIGVLATERTVGDPYLRDLIDRYAADKHVVPVAATGLVEAIEAGHRSESELSAALAQPAATLRRERVDTVVLGCTHFVHVRPLIERLLGPAVTIVDSVDGVARQTVRTVEQQAVESDRPPEASGSRSVLFTSSDPPPAYQQFAGEFDLHLHHANRYRSLRK